MIDRENLFKGSVGPMCARDADAGDLARAAQAAIDAGARQISVDASHVSVVWPWLENTGVEIIARITPSLDNGMDACMSDLAVRAKKAFKQGAGGAQIFIRNSDLNAFANAIAPIRDDLFFNKKLSIALDLAECDGHWADVFAALNVARADSVLLTLTRDAGDKSYFVGWIYALLQVPRSWRGALHFALGRNPTRVEQVQRLAQGMREEVLAELLFFVNN